MITPATVFIVHGTACLWGDPRRHLAWTSDLRVSLLDRGASACHVFRWSGSLLHPHSHEAITSLAHLLAAEAMRCSTTPQRLCVFARSNGASIVHGALRSLAPTHPKLSVEVLVQAGVPNLDSCLYLPNVTKLYNLHSPQDLLSRFACRLMSPRHGSSTLLERPGRVHNISLPGFRHRDFGSDRLLPSPYYDCASAFELYARLLLESSALPPLCHSRGLSAA